MADETVRLRVRVAPGAASDEIAGRHGDAWKVRVSAAPEKGRANDAVLDLLARRIGVPRAAVALVGGHGSRNKLVELRGVTRSGAEQRLEMR